MKNTAQLPRTAPGGDDFLDSREFARMSRAISYINEHYTAQPKLAAVARHVGLSEFHFNRLFRRWTGLTPKQYLAQVTSVAARAALRSETSVLAAAHAVGLSGSSRLHDLVVTLEAFSPGELRLAGAGVEIHYGHAASPFGLAFVALTARGLCRLGFLEGDDDLDERSAVEHAWPNAELVRDDAAAAATVARIWGRQSARAPLHLAVCGTNFQVQVWRALLGLDPAQSTSYGALAAQLGRTNSPRAIGNAVGANPLGYIIPCHRVLRGNGALGGYRWGIERKQMIRLWEGLHPPRTIIVSANRPRLEAR